MCYGRNACMCKVPGTWEGFNNSWISPCLPYLVLEMLTLQWPFQRKAKEHHGNSDDEMVQFLPSLASIFKDVHLEQLLCVFSFLPV